MSSKQRNTEPILASLTQAEGLLRDILDGQKPFINPAASGGWIHEQLARMRAGLFISDVPKAFVTLPGEGDAEAALKGDTRYHAFPQALLQRKENLDRYLPKAGIHNYKVLGADLHYRDTRKNPIELTKQAEALVLTRGDVYALWQFVSLLKDRLESGKHHDTKLVVQNSRGFWDPMIEGLGLNTAHQTLMPYGLHFTDNGHDTEKTLGQILSRKGIKAAYSDLPFSIPPGSTLLLATKGRHKIHELRSILEAAKVNVKIYPFHSLVKKPREASETNLTYAGNAMEKMDKVFELVDSEGYEKIAASLKRRGIDPKKTFIWIDDRGLATEEDLTTDPIFDACRSFINAYKETPGPELAHFLKALSRQDLATGMKRSAEAIEARRKAAGDERVVDLAATDWTTYAVAPLKPAADRAQKVQIFTAGTKNVMVFEPRPVSDPHYYSEHYLCPEGDTTGRTNAEIPGYLETMSPMALAARAVIKCLDMDQSGAHAPSLSSEFKSRAGRKRWQVVTQHTLYTPNGQGTEAMGLKRHLNGQFRLVSGRNGKYDISPGDNGEIYFNNLHKMAQEAQCFLLLPEENEQNRQRNFARNMLYAFSVVVGKQIFDPIFAGKPFSIVGSHKPGGVDDFKRIYDHLHVYGFIGDKPEHLFRDYQNAETAMRYFGRYMQKYVPDNVSQSSFWKTENSVEAPRHLSRVTIYCSATSTNEKLLRDAHNLAWDLAACGFAVKNGGGKEGLMVATSLGVHRFRQFWEQKNPGKMPENHVSSIQADDTYQSEGLCDFNDYVCVHPNIFERMQDLTDTEAEIVLAGGAGTIQEMMASVYLRQQSPAMARGKPLVIVNTPVGEGKNCKGVYDPVLEAMPADMLRDLNIHVVDTVEQALEIVRQARRERGMEPPEALSAETLQALRKQRPNETLSRGFLRGEIDFKLR